MTSPSTSNKRGKQLALGVGSTLFMLGLAEVTVRVLGIAPPRFHETRHLESADKRIGIDVYPREGATPELHYPTQLLVRGPNVNPTFGPREFAETDALILRMPDLASWAEAAPLGVVGYYSEEHCRVAHDGDAIPLPSPTRKRVLFVGDSFIEGQGVMYETIASTRVADALHRTDVDVINCGRRGYDFPALGDFIEAHLTDTPELVVYAMTLNDAERSEAFQAQQSYVDDWIVDRRRMTSGTPSTSSFTPRLFALAQDRLEGMRIGAATMRWYEEMYAAPNEAGWAHTLDRLEALRTRIESHGGRLLIALWPLLTRLSNYPFDATHETISFRREDEETLWVHAVDHHPNSVAHSLFAGAILPSIESSLREIEQMP
jgi:hypothetical protein